MPRRCWLSGLTIAGLLAAGVVVVQPTANAQSPTSPTDPRLDAVIRDVAALRADQQRVQELLQRLEGRLAALPPAPGTAGAVGPKAFDIAPFRTLGSATAPLVLIEMADYQCPFCRRHFKETFPALDQQYIQTGKVQYVFVDTPIERIHPLALPAAEATHCAQAQGKYWEMHRALFTQEPFTDFRDILRAGTKAGLQMDALQTCLNGEKHAAAIRAVRDKLATEGVTATPHFLIGVKEGPGTLEILSNVVDHRVS